jgi:transposase
MSQHRYQILLTSEQRQELERLVHTGIHPSPQFLRAQILLLADRSGQRSPSTDSEIATQLGISRRTVIRTKQRFVQEHLKHALATHYPVSRPSRRRLDGHAEARLIALACESAPDGYQRWSLRLLADKAVELNIVEHISPETVRQTLKKTNSSRG